jgi:hypothetical protein
MPAFIHPILFAVGSVLYLGGMPAVYVKCQPDVKNIARGRTVKAKMIPRLRILDKCLDGFQLVARSGKDGIDVNGRRETHNIGTGGLHMARNPVVDKDGYVVGRVAVARRSGKECRNRKSTIQSYQSMSTSRTLNTSLWEPRNLG